MKVVIAGSRTFSEHYYEQPRHAAAAFAWVCDRIADGLVALKPLVDFTIVQGGARGIDNMAAQFAHMRGYPTVTRQADWDKYGKRAGYIRNKEMVDESDAGIVIWDGQSKGTKHTLKLLTDAKLPYVLYVTDPTRFAA